MSVVDAIKLLHGYDRQFVYERNNQWGELADLVEKLAEHAATSLCDSELYRGYQEIKSEGESNRSAV